jgi:hypothetical protein
MSQALYRSERMRHRLVPIPFFLADGQEVLRVRRCRLSRKKGGTRKKHKKTKFHGESIALGRRHSVLSYSLAL